MAASRRAAAAADHVAHMQLGHLVAAHVEHRVAGARAAASMHRVGLVMAVGPSAKPTNTRARSLP